MTETALVGDDKVRVRFYRDWVFTRQPVQVGPNFMMWDLGFVRLTWRNRA